MRFKIKTSWIGLFLIAIMLFSTFAYAVIQSFYPKQKTELPKTNIIDYPLNSNLKNSLIQYGITVVTFSYNINCENCAIEKSILEFYATEHKQVLSNDGPVFSIYLEELMDSTLDRSKISMESVYGKEELIGANETDIFNALCKIMVSPPVTCALKT